MENLNVELTPVMLAMVPVVAAIIQMLKRIPKVLSYKEWLPVFSIVISFLLLYLEQGGTQGGIPILPSVIVGLTACGGFDLLKEKKSVS